MEAERLIRACAEAGALLVATDFDGTVAPIVEVPSEARMLASAERALAALAQAPGVTVAVVSGRTRGELEGFTAGLGPVYRVAEHGAVVVGPGGEELAEAVGGPPEVMAEVLALAEALAAAHPGARVERKRYGVALHARGVPLPGRPAALEALGRFAEEARSRGLAAIAGRMVAEACPPEATKAGALARIAARLPEGARLVYAGDDTTDTDAIAHAHAVGGFGVFVASAERPEPLGPCSLVLGGPGAWARVLELLAAARAAAR